MPSEYILVIQGVCLLVLHVLSIILTIVLFFKERTSTQNYLRLIVLLLWTILLRVMMGGVR